MSTPAERQRALRARRKQGQAVFRLVLDEVDTVEMLVAGGFLLERDQDDREVVEAALEDAIGLLVQLSVTRNHHMRTT